MCHCSIPPFCFPWFYCHCSLTGWFSSLLYDYLIHFWLLLKVLSFLALSFVFLGSFTVVSVVLCFLACSVIVLPIFGFLLDVSSSTPPFLFSLVLLPWFFGGFFSDWFCGCLIHFWLFTGCVIFPCPFCLPWLYYHGFLSGLISGLHCDYLIFFWLFTGGDFVPSHLFVFLGFIAMIFLVVYFLACFVILSSISGFPLDVSLFPLIFLFSLVLLLQNPWWLVFSLLCDCLVWLVCSVIAWFVIV